ncbi:hypothetical protein Btru_041191 [Bulinus truncatus]|nr:hypothetical protein Btru_041191 [Bulinus truncatus]
MKLTNFKMLSALLLLLGNPISIVSSEASDNRKTLLSLLNGRYDNRAQLIIDDQNQMLDDKHDLVTSIWRPGPYQYENVDLSNITIDSKKPEPFCKVLFTKLEGNTYVGMYPDCNTEDHWPNDPTDTCVRRDASMLMASSDMTDVMACSTALDSDVMTCSTALASYVMSCSTAIDSDVMSCSTALDCDVMSCSTAIDSDVMTCSTALASYVM